MVKNKGFTYLTVVFMVFILTLSLAVVIPVWQTVIRRAMEKETIFRGSRIVKGIQMYMLKHPGTFPKNLDILVKEKFIRKHWKDPLSKDGYWYLVMTPGGPNPKYVILVKEQDLPKYKRPTIIGVAPQAKGPSILKYRGETNYENWLFIIPLTTEEKPKVKYWKG